MVAITTTTLKQRAWAPRILIPSGTIGCKRLAAARSAAPCNGANHVFT
jgi:hypothetical protein